MSIKRENLITLEAYAKVRGDFRTQVIAHKQNRKVALGDHVTLLFEDDLTMRYQVQEMLRAEKIFEESDIQAELDTYNLLTPDGSNWKATMLIEYPDVAERAIKLTQLKGIERKVWVQVAGNAKVFAIADEDMERENEEKTSAVHFLRFELDAAMRKALRSGAALEMGIDHPVYSAHALIADTVRDALLKDFAG